MARKKSSPTRRRARENAPPARRSGRPRHCCDRRRNGARRAVRRALASRRARRGGIGERAREGGDRRLKPHGGAPLALAPRAIAASARRASASKRRPIRNVVVPFDQRRRRPDAAIARCVERPDAGANRRIVGVDQQRRAGVVFRLGIAGEMDLADMLAAGRRRDRRRGRSRDWSRRPTTLLTSSSSPQPVRRTISARKSVSGIALSANST